MAVGQPLVNERPLRRSCRQKRLTGPREQSESAGSRDGGDKTKTEPRGQMSTTEASSFSVHAAEQDARVVPAEAHRIRESYVDLDSA